MAAAIDGVLRHCVKAETGEDHVVITLAVRVADHVLYLLRRDVANFRADTHSHAAFLFVAVYPLALRMDERGTGQRVESAELHVLVAGEIYAARLEQPDDLVEMRLSVG